VQRRQVLVPGVTELEASNAIRDLAAELLGVTRHWHKPVVRPGPNTLEPYAAVAYFQAHPDSTGEQLHAEVVRLSEALGWELGNYHSGHLVGEFPHVQDDTKRTHFLIMAGSDKPMRRPDLEGKRPHWILEIHLVDREHQIGGFYEELLTL
jgi:hypothetical protein